MRRYNILVGIMTGAMVTERLLKELERIPSVAGRFART
jgi:hypothetical protein